MALPYGQDALGALALGSDPLRRKLRPLWGGSLDFQAFAASLSSRAQCLCAFRDILGGQSQCLCGFPGTRTNGHELLPFLRESSKHMGYKDLAKAADAILMLYELFSD